MRAISDAGHLAISNVYSDSNRGGALLTYACAQALERIAPGRHLVLIPTTADQPRANFKFTLDAMEAVSVATEHPLRLSSHQLSNAVVAEWLRRRNRISRPPRPLRGKGYGVAATAGLVVGKGGQLFRDYSNAAGLRSFTLSAAPLVVGAAESVPTALYGVQVGPYRNPSAMRAAAAVLQRVEVVLARDETSAQVSADLGARHVVLIPDTVFGILAADIIGPTCDCEERYDVLVVAANIWKLLGAGAVDAVIDLMEARVRRGLADSVVVTAQSGADDGVDYVLAAQISARLSETVPSRFVGPSEVGDLLRLYRGANVVVTGRVHAGIMALIVGTPGLVVCPGSSKALDLFRSVGFAEVAIGPGSSETVIGVLRERLNAIESDSCFSQHQISSRVSGLRARLIAADQELADLIGTIPGRG